MAANEVAEMIGEALKAMAVGIPGVFAVLSVFFVAVKLLMARTPGDGGQED